MAARSLEFVLMRGGTSKGVFLRRADVPDDRSELSALLLDIFGSPDRRQIDGLGGADKLTSKAAIVGPSTVEGADMDYLFGQVGIETAQVDYLLNCGNLTAAAAQWAIEEGLVAAYDGQVEVRVHNVNTGRIIRAFVPCQGGEPVTIGDYAISGVPGTGAPIGLDFAAAGGAITGTLLPLGQVTTSVLVPDMGPIEVSLVDCANLVVFIEASTVGLTARETAAELDANTAAVAKINKIRRAVAHQIGLGDYFDNRAAPASPIAVVLAPSHAPDQADLNARIYANGATSRAYAGTVTACTGVAALLQGSLVQRVLPPDVIGGRVLRIAHPAGVIEVDARRDASSGEITRALIHRTARRIAEGRVYLKESS